MYNGYKIQQYRKALNMNITELAEKVGTSRPYISDIEHGKKKASFEMIEKIAAVLNVRPIDFMDNNEVLEPHLIRLLDIAKDMNPSIIENIIKLMASIKENL